MANIKISDLAFAITPLDTPNTFLEVTVFEAGVEVSRRITVDDLPSGGGGAVNSVTGGVNINVTGTAADPVVNLDAAITGVSVNGVTLNNAGAATNYLDETGAYSVPPSTPTAPGGADTAVQFNNAGAFGGSPDFEWDGSILKLEASQAQLTLDETDGGGLASIFLTSTSTADSGIRIEFDSTSGTDARIRQVTSGGTPEDIWISFAEDAEVGLFHNGLEVAVTATHGLALFGAGAGGVTGTRIEFLDALPGGTRNFVIGALGLNQSNILDEQLNRPLRIATTSAGGIENIIIGTPNGDTLLQGNTGVRVQTATGVVDFRTPSLRFSMNSAGQLNLLGNGTQSGVINFTEGTSAFGSVAGEGQLWVRNDTPNVLVFTDDAGTDFDLNAGGGAPTNATYVVISLDATLTDERVLTAGTGISLADGGAGGNATLTVDQATNFVFSGDCEFTAVQGLTLGPSCELDMRNSGDTSTTFIQNLGPTLQFGIAGGDFGSGVFEISQSSFERVECPTIFLSEEANLADIAGEGQLWVRAETFSNTLMYTNDNGNDFPVAGLGALAGDISAGSNLITGTAFVSVANVSPRADDDYIVIASVEVTAPAADDMNVRLAIPSDARFYGTLSETETGTINIIEGQVAEVVTNSVLVPTSGAATPGGSFVTIIGRLVGGATTGTMSLQCGKNADTGADGNAIRGALQLIPIAPI